MILFSSDLKRLSCYYRVEDFAFFDGRFWRLKNLDGRCVFLDLDGKKCKIYEMRPLGCRLYPVVWDPERGAIVDEECPMRHTVTADEVLLKAKILLRAMRKEGLCRGR